MALDIHEAFQGIASDERFIQDTREIIQSRLSEQNTSDLFTIVPGIKGGQQVAAMKGIEYVTTADEGCGGASLSPTFPAISQKWNPKLCKVKIKYCFADFKNFFTQWALGNGYDIKKLDEADFFSFIVDFVEQAMRMDMQRVALFGDENISTQNILNDTNKVKFYDLIGKGLIPTLQYFKTIESLQDNFVALDLNSNPDQFTMGEYYAKNIYKKVIDNDFFDTNQLLSSNSLYKNYEDLIEGNVRYLESNKIDIQKGLPTLSIRGQQITRVKHYDRWRNNDFKKDGVTHLPHFALAANKEHLQIGVDSESVLNDLVFEYIGGDDEHFYIKGNYMMDFKMVNPFEFKAAI
ncbi:hypothetical protein V2605_03475 [Tenacibaculum maritimum]|uniref:hypothetical protein n=1 Tax=Tenacibaculum maritimum TaxID=107401 RepID=UPI0012E506ED|nr:hypothetical protein [Tenacibaculum maritimum]CAA0254684.1 hypothetical protein DPIF8902391_90083 [Tenacibaculum maritimum]